MHPCLSAFPSNKFYEGTLQNGLTEADRTIRGLGFPWYDMEKPMMFISCDGREEYSGTATSYLNRFYFIFLCTILIITLFIF